MLCIASRHAARQKAQLTFSLVQQPDAATSSMRLLASPWFARRDMMILHRIMLDTRGLQGAACLTLTPTWAGVAAIDVGHVASCRGQLLAGVDYTAELPCGQHTVVALVAQQVRACRGGYVPQQV